MSGSPSLTKYNEAIDLYEQSVGLGFSRSFKGDIAAAKYINMSLEDIRSISYETCNEAAIVLSQYAFYLQKLYNEEVAKANWATAQLRRVLADEVMQYNAPSADERRMQATKHNDVAMGLEQARVEAQAKADTLAFLAARMDSLADKFLQARKKNG